jgi:hypothetical protein
MICEFEKESNKKQVSLNSSIKWKKYVKTINLKKKTLIISKEFFEMERKGYWKTDLCGKLKYQNLKT